MYVFFTHIHHFTQVLIHKVGNWGKIRSTYKTEGAYLILQFALCYYVQKRGYPRSSVYPQFQVRSSWECPHSAPLTNLHTHARTHAYTPSILIMTLTISSWQIKKTFLFFVDQVRTISLSSDLWRLFHHSADVDYPWFAYDHRPRECWSRGHELSWKVLLVQVDSNDHT